MRVERVLRVSVNTYLQPQTCSHRSWDGAECRLSSTRARRRREDRWPRVATRYSPSASAQTAESQSNTSHAHEPLHVCGGLRVEDAKAAAFYDICRVVDTTFASITADYLLQLHGAAAGAAVGRSQIAVEFDSQIDQVAGEALLLAAGYKDIGSLFMADQQLALTAGAQRLQSLHGGLYVGELDHLVRSTLCNPNLGRLLDSRGCCVACALIRKDLWVLVRLRRRVTAGVSSSAPLHVNTVHVMMSCVTSRGPVRLSPRVKNYTAMYTAHMKKLYLV